MGLFSLPEVERGSGSHAAKASRNWFSAEQVNLQFFLVSKSVFVGHYFAMSHVFLG
jgi:hypothetical protein